MSYDILELSAIAAELRRKVMKMAIKAGGAHIGPAFSCIEILTAIYFGEVMRYNPNKPDLPDRDRLILSKGHASAALFAVLAQAGFFHEQLLDTYCQPGSVLGGHPRIYEVPGVEASTGALGHGFSYAMGIALAGKMNESSYKVVVILGDGECQEGSVWEAALFGAQHKLGNLTAIVDYNKMQAMDRIDQITNIEPFADKWRSFGWDVYEIDGHDLQQIISVLEQDTEVESAPRLVIAHTVKGKGVSFMENEPLWHYRLPNIQEMEIAKRELYF